MWSKRCSSANRTSGTVASLINRGRQRLQFRRRSALAREVSQRHQRLGAHARVIVIEQLAQLRYRDLDCRVSRTEAPQAAHINSSISAFASLRSGVPNPSVNQP